ncbi:response regulator [Blastopirellula sp. JC732]|uniref:Response regulator n=1 Tax=Blastopirellula sediminis TaxID=2894196 RepID=A0A9X1MJX8_9BACT|nr:response regulator [Blastopirellula sediminis]MCC9608715.1 response regulator [Blastopirellula sediminis]MCC9628508.1 response regulator [Blastopirellula sediminis]
MARLKVLIVEDDRSLADVLAYNVRQAGYEVISAYDGQDGLTQAQIKTPDLVILDLMLPVIDGHEVCRRLRADASTKDMMILMLTAKSEESDQLIGFSLGADDYVTKPFSVKVLLERIKALVRRKRGADNSHDDVIASQGITIDRRRHRATASGRPLQLTRSEFRLLETLTRQPGRVFERSELIDAALGEDTVVMERTIDVHIRALRRKMADEAELIETVRGVGYRFRDPGAVTDTTDDADIDHAVQH